MSEVMERVRWAAVNHGSEPLQRAAAGLQADGAVPPQLWKSLAVCMPGVTADNLEWLATGDGPVPEIPGGAFATRCIACLNQTFPDVADSPDVGGAVIVIEWSARDFLKFAGCIQALRAHTHQPTPIAYVYCLSLARVLPAAAYRSLPHSRSLVADMWSLLPDEFEIGSAAIATVADSTCIVTRTQWGAESVAAGCLLTSPPLSQLELLWLATRMRMPARSSIVPLSDWVSRLWDV